MHLREAWKAHGPRLFDRTQRVAVALYLVGLFALHGGLIGMWAVEHHRWAMGDWLINYQGGFVRRGLLGEVLYRLALASRIDPVYWVAGVQVVALAVYFTAAYLALQRQRDWRPYWLLLASPYLFAFSLMDPQGGMRKEILFLALLAWMVQRSLRAPQRVEAWTLGALAGFPFLVLSHEMFFLYLPYVLVPLVYVQGGRIRREKLFWTLLAANFLAFAAAVMARGTPEQTARIVASLQQFYPWKPQGALGYLAMPVQCVLCRATPGRIALFLRGFAVAGLAFLPLRERLARLLQNAPVRWLWLVTWVATLPLFVIALDWGRFVYIHLAALFLVSLLDTRPVTFELRPRELIVIYGLFAFLYFDLWYLQHVRGFQLTAPPEDNLRRLLELARRSLAVMGE